MTVRDTSIQAYEGVMPTIGKRQALVLGVLQRSEPMSNSEIARELGWEINKVTPRVKELRDSGLVIEMDRRTCRVTGMNVLTWSVPRVSLF